jgi:hypothetical protein
MKTHINSVIYERTPLYSSTSCGPSRLVASCRVKEEEEEEVDVV